MGTIGKKVWALGSGKGGVGKSFLTAGIGTELARMGKSVAAVDANPASPNLHGFLGADSPGLGLLDILEGRSTLEEISLFACETRLRLLSLAGDRLSGEKQTTRNLEQLFGLIQSLEEEYVLVDLRPGASADVMEFFNRSDAAILVTTPHPASTLSARKFLKQAVFHRMIHGVGAHASVTSALLQLEDPEKRSSPTALKDFLELVASQDQVISTRASALIREYRPGLVVNMASTGSQDTAAEEIERAAQKDLDLTIKRCGSVCLRNVPDDTGVANLPAHSSETQAEIRRVIDSLLEASRPEINSETVSAGAIAPTMGFNDNVDFMGKELHIQTEDSRTGDGCITTQVFCNGRVIMSTRSDYPDTSGVENRSGRIMELMRTQHFQVIRQIESKKAALQPAQC